MGIGSIHVRLTPDGQGGLALRYRVAFAPGSVRVPADGEPLPRDRLWGHTCCELFVAEEGGTAYREFNFSPCGQWMRFDFSDYRQRCVGEEGPPLALAVAREDDEFILSASLPPGALPEGPVRLALTVVVEQRDGRLGYWALAHPPGKPDFHHRAGFLVAGEFPRRDPS